MRVASSVFLALSAVQTCLSFTIYDDSSTRPTIRDLTSKKTVALSWYTGWNAANFTPEEVSWDKYDVIAFSFVIPTPNIVDTAVADEDDATLRKLVQLGHAHNTAIIVSVGGWTGSVYFSSSVATKENRTEFVKVINNIITKYDLDGVDFDWEYPNKQGIGCNTISNMDTPNFLEFLKELRASGLKKDAIVSVPTAVRTFRDEDGNPSDHVGEFAKYLTWIEIMNYDVWSPFSNPTTGPVGPLDDSCVADLSTQALGSAVSALQTWIDAGFPKEKILLGVPAYGYGYAVSQEDAFNPGSKTQLANSFRPYDPAKAPFGDAWQGPPSPDVCGVMGTASSVYNFWSLNAMGLVDSNGLPAEGVLNCFDECAKSSSIYDAKSGIWYEYDDPRSYKVKGQFLHDQGLKGFAMWETAGDWNDLLLDAIRDGAQFSKVNGDPHRTVHPTTAKAAPT